MPFWHNPVQNFLHKNVEFCAVLDYQQTLACYLNVLPPFCVGAAVQVGMLRIVCIFVGWDMFLASQCCPSYPCFFFFFDMGVALVEPEYLCRLIIFGGLFFMVIRMSTYLLE